MHVYKFLQYALYTSLTFTAIIVFILVFFVYKEYCYTDRLSNKVYELGKGITNEKIEDFITYIDCKKILPRQYTINLILSGHKLIIMSQEVDEDVKLRLKVLILSKGILVD